MAAPAQPALFMTDRYGDPFPLARRRRPGAGLLDWARFISIRCEECFPPEWPRSSSAPQQLAKNRRAALNPPPSFTRIS
jgi:hypothetical protein